MRANAVTRTPSTRLADWLVLGVIVAATLYSFVDRFILSTLIEPIKADLHLSDAQLGLLTGAAFSFFNVTMSLPIGWLADRWSRKGVIIIGMSVWSAATAISGLASSLWAFGLARMAVGAGEASLSPTALPIIYARFAKGPLALAMSIYSMGVFVGSGLALVVVGATYAWFDAHAGQALPLLGGLAPWQQTFLALSLPGVPLILAIACIPDRRDPAAARAASAPGASSIFRELRQRGAFFGPLFFGAGTTALVTFAMLSWLPAILMREFHWSPARIGPTYGLLITATSIGGVLLAGAAVEFMVRRKVHEPYLKVLVFTALSCLMCVGAFALADTADEVLASAGLLHFFMAMPAVTPAYLQMHSPDHLRGQLSSVYSLAINVVGLGVGVPLVGLCSSSLFGGAGGLRAALVLVSSFSLVISLLLFLHLTRTRRRGAAISTES